MAASGRARAVPGAPAARCGRRLGVLERAADVGDLAIQPQRVLRHVDEAPAAIKARGGFVDGIDDYEACRDRVAGGDGPPQRFGEQATAQPVALVAAVDGEAGDQDGRHRMAGHPAHVTFRGVFATYRAGGEAHIPGDRVTVQREVGACEVGALAGERMAGEPPVERLVAAVEAGDVVLLGEEDELEVAHRSAMRGSLSSSVSSPTGSAAPSSAAANVANVSSLMTRWRRSSSISRARC